MCRAGTLQGISSLRASFRPWSQFGFLIYIPSPSFIWVLIFHYMTSSSKSSISLIIPSNSVFADFISMKLYQNIAPQCAKCRFNWNSCLHSKYANDESFELKTCILKYKIKTGMHIVFKTENIQVIENNLRSFSSLSVSDGAAVHGPEGPRQCAVDCGAGSGGQERSQHQVRDHYFLTYTRLVHSCVCVPFRGCPVLGPRPGVGHERRTPPRHLTGWKIKNKTSRPAPVSRACPLHDDVWRCAVSLFFLLVSSLSFLLSPFLARAPSSCLQGWRMTFEPRAMVHFSVSTCRGNGSVFPLPVCRSVCSQPVGCSASSYLFCFFLPVDGCNRLASSLSSFFYWLPPSLTFFTFQPLCQTAPDNLNEICYQNTAKRCDSVLAVCWAQSGSWQWWGLLSKHDNWRKGQTF